MKAKHPNVVVFRAILKSYLPQTKSRLAFTFVFIRLVADRGRVTLKG